jgi:hypothetical protein
LYSKYSLLKTAQEHTERNFPVDHKVMNIFGRSIPAHAKTLLKIVHAVLSIPVSNALFKRVFSSMDAALTKSRNRLVSV